MMRRLRLKLIAACMLSLLLVLAIIMCALNALNYRGAVQDADSVLDLLKENEGQFPQLQESFDWETDGPRYKSPELPFEIRFFSVLMRKDGEIKGADMVQIAAVDEAAVAEYARMAFESGSERGFVEDYRFIRYAEAEDVRIIFLDYGRVLSNHRSMLLNSVLISAAGLLAVFLLIVLLSKRIMKPFAENYEKQKLFVTDAGHEIKTPITIIDAAAEVLEMEYGENEWLQCIRQQADRLGMLTDDLIRLSRMEENRALPMVSFPFSELAAEAADSFYPLARAQNKSLQLQIQQGVAWRGHEDSMRQLLSVLLDNALKYSPENSTIYLRLEKRSKGILLQVENESIQLLTKESMEKMFDRFWRGDPSRSSRTRGYGIGLSIAKAVVNAHRGKISADTPDGRRLVISVTLPNWFPMGENR